MEQRPLLARKQKSGQTLKAPGQTELKTRALLPIKI